jgi:hypothetical protein
LAADILIPREVEQLNAQPKVSIYTGTSILGKTSSGKILSLRAFNASITIGEAANVP